MSTPSRATKATAEDQSRIDANRELGISARRVLEDLLKIATSAGYFGRVTLSISATNGTLATIEETTQRTRKAPR